MAEVGSEASDAESPRFEDDGGREAVSGATSGAGKALLEEEEEKEEEDEDRDMHFKRKQKKPEPKERAPKEPIGRSLVGNK